MQLLCPRVLTATFLFLDGTPIVCRGRLAPGMSLGLEEYLRDVATSQP